MVAVWEKLTNRLPSSADFTCKHEVNKQVIKDPKPVPECPHHESVSAMGKTADEFCVPVDAHRTEGGTCHVSVYEALDGTTTPRDARCAKEKMKIE